MSDARAPSLRHAAEFGTMRTDEGRKAGVTETRRKFFALSGGISRRSRFATMTNNTTLSIFVDGFNLYYGALKGTLYKWLDR